MGFTATEVCGALSSVHDFRPRSLLGPPCDSSDSRHRPISKVRETLLPAPVTVATERQSPMRKLIFALAIVLAVNVETMAQGLSPSTAQSPSTPLVVYAWPVSGLIDGLAGVDCQPTDWWVRKAVADAFDFLFTPHPELLYHPLLDPNVAPFVSTVHKARYWRAIDTIRNQPAPAPGAARVTQFYSSGHVVETTTMKYSVDLCEGPFAITPMTPFANPIDPAMVTDIVDKLDIAFFTHLHADHLSWYVLQEMAVRGKYVVVTQDIKDIAVAAGAPFANMLIVPQQGVTYTFVSPNPIPGVPVETLTYTAYNGMQYMGPIGDPTNPYNVQNNGYLINVNSLSIDVTVLDLGDNNDPGVVSWVAQQIAGGYSPDIVFNLGALWSSINSLGLLAPTRKYLTHAQELTHNPPNFMPLALGSSNNPNRMVLFWGESETIFLP